MLALACGEIPIYYPELIRLGRIAMRRISSRTTALAIALGTQAIGFNACAQQVKVTIDGGQRSDPVSLYEYGMFIEPIGNLVARTLWAEMLDDRKFYYPVVAASKDAPPPPNAEGRPGVTVRKWRPIGGD